MAEFSIFPSLLPDEDKLSKDDIVALFDDDHKLIQQAAVICNEWSNSQTPINGQSSKSEIIDYLHNSMSEKDLETIRQKAEDNLDD